MPTPVSIRASYVLIFEWLNGSDQKTGSAHRDRLEQRNVPVVLVECHSAADIRDGVTRAIEQFTVRGTPIVHIESHGSDPDEDPLPLRDSGPTMDWSCGRSLVNG